MLIETVKLLSKPIENFICIETVLEIDGQHLAFRAEPESKPTGLNPDARVLVGWCRLLSQRWSCRSALDERSTSRLTTRTRPGLA